MIFPLSKRDIKTQLVKLVDAKYMPNMTGENKAYWKGRRDALLSLLHTRKDDFLLPWEK